MILVTRTQSDSAGPPVSPSAAVPNRARQLLGVARQALPLDRASWSGAPRFGEQPRDLVGEIQDSVAFTAGRTRPSRMLPNERPLASPLQVLNRLGTYRAAFYRDVATQGPRRLDEGEVPASAAWRRPVVRPVRDAFVHLNRPIGSFVGIMAQMGVDAGIGLCALIRAVRFILMLQFERAGMVAYYHAPHLAALAGAIGACLVLGALAL